MKISLLLLSLLPAFAAGDSIPWNGPPVYGQIPDKLKAPGALIGFSSDGKAVCTSLGQWDLETAEPVEGSDCDESPLHVTEESPSGQVTATFRGGFVFPHSGDLDEVGSSPHLHWGGIVPSLTGDVPLMRLFLNSGGLQFLPEALRFSPDGRHLAVCCNLEWEPTTSLWSVTDFPPYNSPMAEVLLLDKEEEPAEGHALEFRHESTTGFGFYPFHTVTDHRGVAPLLVYETGLYEVVLRQPPDGVVRALPYSIYSRWREVPLEKGQSFTLTLETMSETWSIAHSTAISPAGWGTIKSRR